MWEADFDIVATESTSADGVSTGLQLGLDYERGGERGAESGVSGENGTGSFEVAEAEAVLVVSQVESEFRSLIFFAYS